VTAPALFDKPKRRRLRDRLLDWRFLLSLAALCLVACVLISLVASGNDRGRLGRQLEITTLAVQRQRVELDCRSRVNKDVTVPQAKLLLAIGDGIVASNADENRLDEVVAKIGQSSNELRSGLVGLESISVDCAAVARRKIPG
jgi:hypothetical protein